MNLCIVILSILVALVAVVLICISLIHLWMPEDDPIEATDITHKMLGIKALSGKDIVLTSVQAKALVGDYNSMTESNSISFRQLEKLKKILNDQNMMLRKLQ